MSLTPFSRTTGRVVVASIAATCLAAGAVSPASAAVVGTPNVAVVGQFEIPDGYETPYGSAKSLASAVGDREVADVAVGNAFAVALLADGTLVGADENVQYMVNDVVARANGRRIVDVEGGYVSAFARLNDGTVLSFETNDYWPVVSELVTATAGHHITDIAGGRYSAAAIDAYGDVVAWGQDGWPTSEQAANAGILGNAVGIDLADQDAIALLNDGDVAAFGANHFSQNNPSAIAAAVGEHAAEQVATLGTTHFALLDDDSVVAWGQHGAEFTAQIDALIGDRAVTSITADSDPDMGIFSLIAVLDNGDVVSFNKDGADHAALVEAIGDNQVSHIVTGPYAVLAIVNEPLVEFSANGQTLNDVALSVTDTVSIDGAALAPNTAFTVLWDGVQTESGTTTGAGTVDLDAGIPDTALAGAHTLELVVDGNSYSTDITVAAGLVSSIPTITGTNRVGQTLTAVRGKWSLGVSFTYSWLRNGVAISGATSSTYTLKAGDRGTNIQVRIKGTKTGFAAKTVTSAKTAAIAYGIFSVDEPYISGDIQVGRTVTAKTGEWTPAASAYSYKWFANNVAIAGATKSTYRVAASIVDKRLTVRITGTKSGYRTAKVTTDSPYSYDFVERGELNIGEFWVDGEFAPGKKLTVTMGGGTSGMTRTLRWYRDGVPMTGVTGLTYTPTSKDLGHDIAARLTVWKAGYYGDSETRSQTIRPALAIGKLTVAGTAQVGQTLTASAPSVPEGTQVLYIWLSKSATGDDQLVEWGPSTYVPLASDKGKKLYVYAIFDKEGFATAYRQSNVTAAILAAPPIESL